MRAPLRTSLILHLIGFIVLVRTFFWLGAPVRNLFWLNSLVRFFILIIRYNQHFVFTWAPHLELHYDCRLQLNFCLIGMDVLVRTLCWLGALVRNLFWLNSLVRFFIFIVRYWDGGRLGERGWNAGRGTLRGRGAETEDGGRLEGAGLIRLKRQKQKVLELNG